MEQLLNHLKRYWILYFGLTFLLVYSLIPASSESSEYVKEKQHKAQESSNDFVSCQDLQASGGDLIEFQRSPVHDHWGIFVGSREVIHAVPNGPKGRDEIQLTSVEDVAHGGLCRVNNLEAAAKRRGLVARKKNEVLQCAFERLNAFRNGTFLYKYELLKNNCEHFATLCKFGVGFSEMVEMTDQKPNIKLIAKGLEKAIDMSS